MTYGRTAYGAHKPVSKAQLAQYIAESIRQHAAAGRVRTIEQYTQDQETQYLVATLLAE